MTRLASPPLALAFLLAAAFALAGCSDASPSPDAEAASSTTSNAPLALDPAPLGATVDPPAPTQGETATLTGSVNHAARVSIDGGPSLDVAEGRWTLTSPSLAFGHTPAVVRIDDGVHLVAVNVTFVRLAQGTFEATYTAYPMHDDLRTTIWYDPGVLASLPQYAGKGTARADTFSVHDFMTAWTMQTATEITYTYSEAFGFGVSHIDGIGQPVTAGAPPYWCYKVNGESADLGISLQTMTPGDTITWDYGACA